MRLLVALALLAGPAPAQDADPPLSAEAFESIVEGKTFDTHDTTGIYGVETFLPGRRAIWRDVYRCMEGTWRPQGDQICFDHEGDPYPYCFTYHDRGGWLMAWHEGNQSSDPIMLYPSEEFVTCEGFLGA
jgi:hypothetical protein